MILASGGVLSIFLEFEKKIHESYSVCAEASVTTIRKKDATTYMMLLLLASAIILNFCSTSGRFLSTAILHVPKFDHC